MWAALSAVLQAIFGSLATAFLAWLKDKQNTNVNRDDAVVTAENETQDVTGEIADAQKQIEPSSDPAELAKRLLARRRFGSPGRLKIDDQS